jgi:SAM-dependent methyltransferase
VSEAPNAAQAEYWNAARHWVDDADGHDEMTGALGVLAMDGLALSAGMRVLDIGCGTGATTREIAGRVAPGDVVGVDISALMLELARSRSAGVDNVTFINADVQTHAFDAASFDAAFSRMGVMFFDDPVAAFANVRVALRPGGRLGFICWQPAAENEWVSLPARAARPWVDLLGGFLEPAGPFAFGEQTHLRGVLEAAGFQDVVLQDVRRPVLVGGHGDVDTAMRFLSLSRIGKRIEAEAGDPSAAFTAVREALAPHATPDGVELVAAVWLVSAVA